MLTRKPVEGYDEPGCGEIWLGGYGLSRGYLKDEAATKALFCDEERFWLRTGDVGKWVNGGLVIVDRLRSIFKLAQGEYVAAEMVQQAYEGIPTIEQLFVYGDSGRICLVGVVIPRKAEIAKIIGKETLSDAEFTAACTNRVVNDPIMEQMAATAKARGLLGFQQVRGIVLDTVPWSPDNNMLTPTFKLRRKNLADKYRAQIDALYTRLAEAGNT
jgi:long-chain acyl-CoA synthetase